MGLIKAAIGSVGGILADQWKEYFYCDSMPSDVLVTKGRKRTDRRSSNTKGNDNVISNGSVIAVADGQCMMIVDQGRIAEFTAEPGEFTYDASSEPSVFTGNLGDSILDSFSALGRRFGFGGDAGKDQRVYYFNTKEILGNKYGTPNPVPFRVVDRNIGLDTDISIRCFGEYSYRICDPMLFYKNVCSNVSSDFTRDQIDSQLKSELLTALGPAFARISEMGIRYSALPGHTMEIADALNDVLSKKWKAQKGIEIVTFGISSVSASEEDAKMIKELQKGASLSNAGLAAGFTVAAQGDAMRAAASNTAGSMTGFMGMGFAQQAGGVNASALYQMAQQSPAPSAANGWKCTCGATVTGKFCPECGSRKPEPAAGWKCACGATATGKFCPECGAKKPENEGWKCACGAVNKGKFCPECGAKKPAGVPQYRCDKCGWQPADPTKAPRFCPECGDPFDNGDII